MIGIIGAMEEEIELLRSNMENIECIKLGEFEFYRGSLCDKETVLQRCGIGKVNAAVGCTMLINKFGPVYIINTGCAGGINPSLHFGDVVISTGLMYHDVDVTAFNYLPGQLPRQPQIFPVDGTLGTYAERAINELKLEKILPSDLNYCRGVIGSGDIFMHEPQRINELRQCFPQITAVEMESTAIAHCCYLFKIPVLVIRSLSDIAGIESPLKFDEFLPVASRHSAEIVKRILNSKE